MPSKRTSSIIGIWVVIAVLLIVDSFMFGGYLLDGLYPGLNGIVNVLIFALIPFIAASVLLDRRVSPTPPSGPSRELPNGARSASGEPIRSTRPKPRIRRDKRAVQLETIIVEPGAEGNTVIPSNSSNATTSELPQGSSSSSRFLRSRRSHSEEDAEMEQQVKEQLDAIELEMAKLEEQLEQNGVSPSLSNSTSEPEVVANESGPNASSTLPNPSSSTLSSDEAMSELQAIDELLMRLEQRKRAGGVEEETYQRLRDKYLKRRSEVT